MEENWINEIKDCEADIEFICKLQKDNGLHEITNRYFNRCKADLERQINYCKRVLKIMASNV